MKVQVIRIRDDYVLNVRYTDELLEDGTFSGEREMERAETCIKERGRYYLSTELYLRQT